jgi:hypothetical protein
MPFILFKQLCYAGVLINLQFDVILYLHQALCTNQDTYHYLFNKQYTTPILVYLRRFRNQLFVVGTHRKNIDLAAVSHLCLGTITMS